jgi:amidase
VGTTIGTELWRQGAGELAAAIRDRRASSREVVEAHLGRIEAVNPRVNAVTKVLAEEALRAADDADRRLAAGDEVGPLHGVPVTVKENIDLAGHPTTQGVAALAGAVPAMDAPHIAHLRAAGAIPLARTNLPDFALRWHTDNAVYGATRNPWDASRTAGGSSGGEGVALATGMTALGIGNDLGGSLRWPAQCSGICSLKPTLGRIPNASSIEPVDSPISLQLMSVRWLVAWPTCDSRWRS